ncbi:contractile injection system protein, VgrG/Pvc8 family [Candidatus Eisenbacteria bacterium]|uniref:Contractile injection system protein, VgrG/Pvc8 family n=1 Tax=Eiseniibacteriota bacterium TaxID=2212470 RepID=A0ABV6YKU7_UNCEI
MRPIQTAVTLSGGTFPAKLLRAELTEKVFHHQTLRLFLSHSYKSEQEAYVPDFTSFVGQSIAVELEDLSLSGDDVGGAQLFFEGTVSRATLGYEPGGLRLEVEAQSGTADLDKVPRTRIFQETTLQELVNQILADHEGSSLASSDVELAALGEKKISFAAQWGETDWQFLLRLCRKFGLFMVARNRSLILHNADPFQGIPDLGAPIKLVLGQNLNELRLGVGATNRAVQASSYQHFGEEGLDPGKGEQIENVRVWLGPSEEPRPTSALAQRGSRGARTGVTGSVVETDDHFSQQEFDAIAKRWGRLGIARMVDGTGTTDALGLGVGSLLRISPAGEVTFEALEGDRFVVTATDHVIDNGVYTVHFCLGAEAAPPLLDPGAVDAEPDMRLLSAAVTSAHDDSNIGRVWAKLNPFSDSAITEEIPVRCLTEASGDGHGTLNLPEIGDEVVLSLDPRAFAAPILLGAAYNGMNKALIANLPNHAEVDSDKLSENNLKYYLTKSGTCILHDTTGDNPRLLISTPSVSVQLSETDGVVIHTRGSGGECQIIGDMEGALTLKAKNITIKAEETINLESGSTTAVTAGSDMTLESEGNVAASATGDLKVKAGMNYEMEAGMKAKEKAATAYEIQGGMDMKLQAALIKINC